MADEIGDEAVEELDLRGVPTPVKRNILSFFASKVASSNRTADSESAIGECLCVRVSENMSEYASERESACERERESA